MTKTDWLIFGGIGLLAYLSHRELSQVAELSSSGAPVKGPDNRYYVGVRMFGRLTWVPVTTANLEAAGMAMDQALPEESAVQSMPGSNPTRCGCRCR